MQLTTKALDSAIGAIMSGPFISGHFRLFTANNGASDENASFGADGLVETVATSYAPVSVSSWGTLRNFPDGSHGYSQDVVFESGDGTPTVAETVIGVCVTDTSSSDAALLAFDYFLPFPPITTGGAGNNVHTTVALAVDPDNSLGFVLIN